MLQNRSYGQLPVPAIPNDPNVAARLASISMEPEQKDPVYRYSGLLTYEKPILEWYGDIVITPGRVTVLRSGVELPNNCVQVRFINVAGSPVVGINGFGARTLYNFDAYNNTEIQMLTLNLGALDTVTVQAAGTGD